MNKDELIAALEAATGPSRELDAEIALGHGWTLMKEWMLSEKYWLDLNEKRAELPNWTGSLDAALTLIRKWSDWRLETCPAGYDFNSWGPEGDWYGHGATAPLAVCLAWARSLP